MGPTRGSSCYCWISAWPSAICWGRCLCWYGSFARVFISGRSLSKSNHTTCSSGCSPAFNSCASKCSRGSCSEVQSGTSDHRGFSKSLLCCQYVFPSFLLLLWTEEVLFSEYFRIAVYIYRLDFTNFDRSQDLMSKGLLPQAKIQDELIAREITINDAEAGVRYKLTKRQTQEEVRPFFPFQLMYQQQ